MANKTIRIAIIGFGNCTGSLVRGGFSELGRGGYRLDSLLQTRARKGGALLSPSAYFCKHPPQQYTDEEARRRTEDFISGRRET